MDHIILVAILAGLASSGHGIPVPLSGPNITIQQLYNAMSQLVVKNMQLDTSLKQLQGDKATLSTTVDQLTSQLEQLQGDKAMLSTTVDQLTSQLEQLQGDKAMLSTTVDQLTRQLENERNKTATCDQKFVATIKDKTASSSDKAQCNEQNKRVNMALSKCESTKSSLQRNQIIHHHVLNASDAARKECQRNLDNMKNVKTELEQCRQIPVKIPLTCKEWNDAGFTKDGKYIIDPDGLGGVDTFEVECLMNSHYGVPVTVMHHNMETRTQVGPGLSGSPYSTRKNVVYQTSIEQIAAVINISAKCEQFIKLDCYHTPITGYGTWYSRDGVPMYYWGGAAPGSGKCACGMTNTCDKPDNKCNCDANDNVWHSDSGFLTDRNTLPVTKMAFGDLDDPREHVFHKLGPLRCYD